MRGRIKTVQKLDEEKIKQVKELLAMFVPKNKIQEITGLSWFVITQIQKMD